MGDLVERLQHAACEAIAEQRSDIERRPEQLRGLVLEIELRPNGGDSLTICDATSYLQRRVRTSSLLGVRG
jgi:hypothetical protein